MSIHTADALILRRYLYRETSVLVNCLTDRYGKLKGLVKGLRVHPNRHRSAMEVLTINRIVFYDTRSSQIHLISQCDLITPLPELQRDLETMRTASLCVELVDHVVPLEEPQPRVYQLLKETLERLALGGDSLCALQVHFIVRLLRLVGFQPQLTECTGCNTVVHEAGYWSARAGGLLCARCLHEDPQAEPATPDMLSALEELSQANETPRLDEPLFAVLQQHLNEFLRWRVERPLKTLTTLKGPEVRDAGWGGAQTYAPCPTPLTP